MNPVKSKFSIIQVILIPLFLLSVSFSLTGLLFLVARKELAEGTPWSETMIWGVLVFGAIALYMVYYYLNKFLSITIDTKGMHFKGLFKNEFIPWSEIEDVKITGKVKEAFLTIGTHYEASIIKLKKEENRVLFAKHYKNFHEIQMALESAKESIQNKEAVNLALVRDRAPHPIKLENYDNLKQFSGNHVISLNGISLYGLISMFLYFFFSLEIQSFNGTIVVTLLIAGVWWYFGNQLHHFYLNKEYLVIENHIWPFRNDQYRIDDLKEIVFEMPPKKSKSLRVIRKNYKSKLYMAGSLRSKTWDELKKVARQTKVKIRNEM